MNKAPLLDDRHTETMVQQLLARLPAYVPEWQPTETGPSWAVIQIYARYLKALAERLNQAPDKNKLAFLDRLGIPLLSAQAARAPVVFQAIENAGDSRVPARTQVGAQVSGRDEPLVFETKQAIGLVAAKLTEVVTVWPGKDAYADHTTAAIGGQPFTVFEDLKPIPHELYLAHNTHFALTGQSIVELQIELARALPNQSPLPIIWEFWDGEVWRDFRPFKEPADATDNDSLDGTLGLTRSGIIRLVIDCGESQRKIINGVESHWIRARIIELMPPATDVILPEIDRLRIRTLLRKAVWRQHIQTLESDNLAVAGYVRDSLGRPLQKVLINFSPTSNFPFASAQTDANGRYRITPEINIEPNIWHFQVRQNAVLPFFRGTFQIDAAPIEMDLTLGEGVLPDLAYTDGLELDLTKSFYPFGQQPQPGTTFYISSEEIFSKPGAQVTLHAINPDPVSDDNRNFFHPRFIAEYWNGQQWLELSPTNANVRRFFNESDFRDRTNISFDVPSDLTPTIVNDRKGWWIRIRLVTAGYFERREISYLGPNPDNPDDRDDLMVFSFTITEVVPPALTYFRMGYTYESPQESPQRCFTYNDFQWQDRTEDARWRGDAFEPFVVVSDLTPTIYLGFDRPLPRDIVSLYWNIEEPADLPATPPLVWEYWTGTNWQSLSAEDETQHLALPGIISVIWPGVPTPRSASVATASGDKVHLVDERQAAQFLPGDLLYITVNGAGDLVTVAQVQKDTLLLTTSLSQDYDRARIFRATMPRFGRPLTWLRTRLQTDGVPPQPTVKELFLNAVQAVQVQTFENEILGSSNAQPNQTFFTRNRPVMVGEVLEVRELEGPRAQVELPILREELLTQGLTEAALRLETDRRTGQVNAIWVRWQSRPNLFFSGPSDRHYVVERSQGRILFGNNQTGLIPPPGIDNIRLQTYRSGGGQAGNVPVGAISQLLAGVLAEGVTNPRAAEGGADGEVVEAVLTRGPWVTRHRYQAISLADYEALAREASPAVAVARALPTTHANGLPAPGRVKVVIMPQSQDPRPQPSFELRQQVLDYLRVRVPASVRDRIAVSGPEYQPIGVEAIIVPLDRQQAGPIGQQVETALTQFLNPLTGGPTGMGWPFGRNVYQSDVASLLERISGVDYVRELNLLLEGTPRGEEIEVPPNRIVVAGVLRVTVEGRM